MSKNQAEHDELCCVYAGLLLFDDKVEITAEKLNKIITASGNTVDSYYPEFFAKYLAEADIKSMLAVSATAGPAHENEEHHEDKKGGDKKGGDKKGGDKKGKKEEKKPKEEKKEEEEEGFMDMFG